jgi:hypothetical protein
MSLLGKILVRTGMLYFLVVFVCPRVWIVPGDIFSIRLVPTTCGTVGFHPPLYWKMLAGEVIYLGHRCYSWYPKHILRIEFPLGAWFRDTNSSASR